LNIVYGEAEKRSFIHLNVVTLAFTSGAIVFMVLAAGATVVVPAVLNRIGPGFGAQILLRVAIWPVLFLVLTAGLALLYRVGPSRDRPRWRWISWGSVLAVVVWLIASLLFSWYAANFGKFNETYGSLGAVIGFMIWMWISAIVVLVGAELNAEMEHQTVRDTTVGGPEPMGHRKAHMADSIGASQG
jgi:membrane protein